MDSRAAPEKDGGFQSSSGKIGVNSRAAPESKGWLPEQLRKEVEWVPEQLRKHQITIVIMSQISRKALQTSKEIIGTSKKSSRKSFEI